MLTFNLLREKNASENVISYRSSLIWVQTVCYSDMFKGLADAAANDI